MTTVRGCDPRTRRISGALSLLAAVLILVCESLWAPVGVLYWPIVALATGGVLMLTRLWRASASATVWVLGLNMCWYDVSRRGHAGPLYGSSLFMGLAMIILGFIVLGMTRRRTAGMP